MNGKNPNQQKIVKVLATLGLCAGVISIVCGALSLHRLQTQYSVMQFLPAHHPALKMDKAVRQRFRIPDRPLFIGLLELPTSQSETWLQSKKLKRLNRLTQEVSALDGVEQVVSIANIEGAAEAHGAISVGRLIDLVPAKNLPRRVLHDPLLTPNLISSNGKTTLLYVVLKRSDVNLMVVTEGKLKNLLSHAFPEAQSSVGGVPAVQTDLGLLLNKELINFLIITVIACALTLFLIFRTLSTVWIPLLLTGYCNLMVFTMMAWTGITFTVLSSTIPILVFIAVVSLSVHILLRVHEDAQHPIFGESRWDLVVRANRAIWLPNLLGALTTCVGFLTLLTSDVPLIRTYGIGVAAAVLMSWALTSLGIVPLLLLMPLPEPRAWVKRPARWAIWTTNHRVFVIASTVALVIGMALVGRHLDWTGRLFDDLPKGQEARQSTEKIDNTMGGVVPMEVVISTPKGQDWSDPAKIARLDKLMDEIRQLSGVGTVTSLPDFLRASGLHESRLPKSRQAIAETYFLYSMSGSNPLSHYLTADNRSARVELKLRDLPSNQVEHLLHQIHARVHQEFPESQVQTGGMGAVVHLVQNEISHELIFGFWQALLLILGLLTVIFRSLRWAVVACVPNLLPPVVLLGFLALTHTPIKPGVAIIFSIALGLAFNNTVYALNRLRQLTGKRKILPVTKAFYEEGNPCLVSTLVVMMGFSVFMFSYFELNRTFGLCMIVSILAGLLGDLVLLPAMLKMAPWLLHGPLFGTAVDTAPATVTDLLPEDADAQDKRLAA